MAQEQSDTDKDLSNIYYVGTDHNVADVGTRAEKTPDMRIVIPG